MQVSHDSIHRSAMIRPSQDYRPPTSVSSSFSSSVAEPHTSSISLSLLLDVCTRQSRHASEWRKVKERGSLQLFKKKRSRRGRTDDAESSLSSSSVGSSVSNSPSSFVIHGVHTIEGFSISEVQTMFSSSATSEFRATMKLLHGSTFIDGAVLSSSQDTGKRSS
jgi:hypothetical protein